MDKNDTNRVPQEGPCGVDRWTSNGYGLCVDGIKVIRKELDNGNETQKDAPDKRRPR